MVAELGDGLVTAAPPVLSGSKIPEEGPDIFRQQCCLQGRKVAASFSTKSTDGRRFPDGNRRLFRSFPGLLCFLAPLEDCLPHRRSFLRGQGDALSLVASCASYDHSQHQVALADYAVPYTRGVDVLMRNINHLDRLPSE